MSRGGIPDGFGRAYRRVVCRRVTSIRATRLAWVLVDAAYAYGSRDVEVGEMLLRREIGMSGWTLAHARDELVQAGLLSVRSVGAGRGARTVWTLRWNKNVRVWAGISEGKNTRSRAGVFEEGNARLNARPNTRPNARPRAGMNSNSNSNSSSPLSPPRGGAGEDELEKELTNQTRRRRDRRTNAERVADAVARAKRGRRNNEEEEA